MRREAVSIRKHDAIATRGATLNARDTTTEQRLVRPKIKPFRLLVSWLVAAAALFIAAWIVPHVEIQTFLGAVVVSLVIAVLNALIPPLVAAIRLPFTLVLGFLLVLVLDALMLLARVCAHGQTPSRSTTSAGRCSRRSSPRPSASSSR